MLPIHRNQKKSWQKKGSGPAPDQGQAPGSRLKAPEFKIPTLGGALTTRAGMIDLTLKILFMGRTESLEGMLIALLLIGSAFRSCLTPPMLGFF